MTDQMTPDVTDKVREIAAAMRAAMRRDDDTYRDAEFLADLSGYIRALEALLPTPTLPTLAGMAPSKRAACQWMQADVKDHSVRYVIAAPFDEDDDAVLIDADGAVDWVSPDRVTPRPDLTRLEWPGDTEAAPAPALPDGWRLADHKDHGRVIVTTENPDKDGLMAFVHRVGYLHRQHDNEWCKPDELTFLDSPTTEGAGTPTGPDHLAVGTVIESADDPRIDALPVGSVLIDSDEEATIKGRGDWTGAGYIPIPSEGAELGPWTVLHIPKEEA